MTIGRMTRRRPPSWKAANFAPADPRESAIYTTLATGNYTAIVQGKNGTTGIALVEVYNLN